ncbi:MAG: hypothetical protein Tsb0021_04210 [Chlamydiales bacterium]
MQVEQAKNPYFSFNFLIGNPCIRTLYQPEDVFWRFHPRNATSLSTSELAIHNLATLIFTLLLTIPLSSPYGKLGCLIIGGIRILWSTWSNQCQRDGLFTSIEQKLNGVGLKYDELPEFSLKEGKNSLKLEKQLTRIKWDVMESPAYRATYKNRKILVIRGIYEESFPKNPNGKVSNHSQQKNYECRAVFAFVERMSYSDSDHVTPFKVFQQRIWQVLRLQLFNPYFFIKHQTDHSNQTHSVNIVSGRVSDYFNFEIKYT